MDPYIPIGFASLMLLIGVFLRKYVKFFQYFLFPSCIIGGFLGFILLSVFDLGMDAKTFTPLSGTLFVFSFISLGLTRATTSNAGAKINKGALWMALIAFAALGGQMTLGYFGWELVDSFAQLQEFTGYGVTVGNGFAQGPGQSIAVSIPWQEAGVPDAVPIAVSFAAIGFLIASFIGVPLTKYGIKKGWATHKTPLDDQHFLEGTKDTDKVNADNCGVETTSSANIDTITFHLAIMGATYCLARVFCIFMDSSFDTKFFSSIFFIWAFLIAVIFSRVIIRTPLAKLHNEKVQNHVTGIFVDYLVTVTLLALSITVLQKYIVHILFVSILATAWTTFLCMYYARRLKTYSLERMVTIYGVNVGTLASGLTLLRIVDPDFKTTAAVESAVCQFYLIPIFIFIIIPVEIAFVSTGITPLMLVMGCIFMTIVSLIGLQMINFDSAD